MICLKCGCECIRNSNSQKYCYDCSILVNNEKMKIHRIKYRPHKKIELVKCANNDCDNIVSRKGNIHKYCSAKCRSLASGRAFRKRNRLDINKYSRIWYKANDRKNIINEKNKYYRLVLKDLYIKQKLKRQGITNPTPEIIEQKRLSLKIKRKINEIQRKINTQGNHGRPNNVLP